jgi:hypothetical protein
MPRKNPNQAKDDARALLPELRATIAGLSHRRRRRIDDDNDDERRLLVKQLPTELRPIDDALTGLMLSTAVGTATSAEKVFISLLPLRRRATAAADSRAALHDDGAKMLRAIDALLRELDNVDENNDHVHDSDPSSASTDNQNDDDEKRGRQLPIKRKKRALSLARQNRRLVRVPKRTQAVNTRLQKKEAPTK